MLPILLTVAGLVTTSPADSATRRLIPVAPAETLAVTVQGAGRPVVLLPGLFGAAFGFRHVTATLAADGYRVVVIEPLGVGGSARPTAADYSLTAQAARIAAVLAHLQLDDVVLVAHSVGAAIAYRLAVQHPDRVLAIVSIEGGPTESASTPSLRLAMRFAGLIKAFGGPGMVRSQVERKLRAASGDDRWVTEEVIAGYTAGASRDFRATVDAMKGIADAEEPWALAPVLGTIAVPVVMLLGGADHQSAPPREQLEQLAAALPHYREIVVPDAGHFVFEEQPAAVVAAVREVTAAIVAAQ